MNKLMLSKMFAAMAKATVEHTARVRRLRAEILHRSEEFRDELANIVAIHVLSAAQAYEEKTKAAPHVRSVPGN